MNNASCMQEGARAHRVYQLFARANSFSSQMWREILTVILNRAAEVYDGKGGGGGGGVLPGRCLDEDVVAGSLQCRSSRYWQRNTPVMESGGE